MLNGLLRVLLSNWYLLLAVLTAFFPGKPVFMQCGPIIPCSVVIVAKTAIFCPGRVATGQYAFSPLIDHANDRFTELLHPKSSMYWMYKFIVITVWVHRYSSAYSFRHTFVSIELGSAGTSRESFKVYARPSIC